MSLKDPGIIFDASNSWNGYNHQGMVALYVAIKTICEKWDKTKTISDNAENLNDYFLELEYLEDFSIGVIEGGEDKYISAHQVKNREDSNLNSYSSALLGLVQHIIDKSKIDKLYLHVTTNLNTSATALLEQLKTIIRAPDFIDKQIQLINEYRGDENLREDLIKSKRGKRPEFKKNIFKILKDLNKEERIKKGTITDDDWIAAFKQYEQSLNDRKDKFGKVSEASLKKIGLYKYQFVEGETSYCPVDKIQDLIKKAIKDFYGLLLPAEAAYRPADENFCEKCFFFLSCKLMEHVIDRDKYYHEYQRGLKDRKIKFGEIINWLTSQEIDSHSAEYYLYYASKKILEYTSAFCKSCKEQGKCTEECRLEVFNDFFAKMSYGQLKDFVYITSPQIKKEINIESYPDFVSSYAFSNHFPKGLREIKKDFSDHDTAIIYKNSDNNEYVLSSIYKDSVHHEKSVCTEIVENTNINSIMMDYDGFISDNMDVSSIFDEAFSPTTPEGGYDGTNITHLKNMKIISLEKFKNDVNK